MKTGKPPRDEANDPKRSADAPNDVAGLYHWANLEGTRYRDFSADRDHARSGRRQRKSPSAAAAPPPSAPGPRRLLTAVKKSDQNPPPTSPGRWSALRSIFDPAAGEVEPAATPEITLDIPSLAFVSAAGGVGKTLLAASVARALATQGHRLLLVDTQPCGMLSLIYGAPDLEPESVSPVAFGPKAAALNVLTLPNAATAGGSKTDANLLQQVAQHAEGVEQVLIDTATGSFDQLAQILSFATNVVVVLTPDMASVAGLQPLRALLESAADSESDLQVHYLLNRFDAASRLHIAIREALAAQLDGHLLPFVLPNSAALQEALADGTALDLYAPEDPLLRELQHLAQWVGDLHPGAAAAPVRRWRAL